MDTNTDVDISESIETELNGPACQASQFSTEDIANMSQRLKERLATLAKEAREKKGPDTDFVAAFRRIKLHVPPEPKSDTEVPPGSEE